MEKCVSGVFVGKKLSNCLLRFKLKIVVWVIITAEVLYKTCRILIILEGRCAVCKQTTQMLTGLDENCTSLNVPSCLQQQKGSGHWAAAARSLLSAACSSADVGSGGSPRMIHLPTQPGQSKHRRWQELFVWLRCVALLYFELAGQKVKIPHVYYTSENVLTVFRQLVVEDSYGEFNTDSLHIM